MLLCGLLCGVIAVLVGCGGGEETVARDDLPRKLDAELAKRSQELGVPGAAAALYRRGELGPSRLMAVARVRNCACREGWWAAPAGAFP